MKSPGNKTLLNTFSGKPVQPKKYVGSDKEIRPCYKDRNA